MFGFLGKIFGFSKAKVSILVVGLDNSGKTTLISRLQAKNDVDRNIVPTVGFTVEKVVKDNVKFTIFDMSGQSTYRGLWESYYADVTDKTPETVEEYLNGTKAEVFAEMQEKQNDLDRITLFLSL